MISFNNLSNLGRLGNQMFQYAALKGIAKNRGLDFCIPPPELSGKIDENVRNSDCNIYRIFNLSPSAIQITQNEQWRERTFNFDQDLFDNCPNNVDLVGYFQNERYFKNIENEIRREFSFSTETLELCQDFIKNQEYISLHIRHGDYIRNPNHPIQPIEYYQRSLEFFDPNLKVIIFSDDFSWCKNQSFFDKTRFLISENNPTEIDLCLQSMCSYHIISNSSFSWWGSYLAKSKGTIAPKLWFSGSLVNNDTSGLYRKSWTII
jgi:hypothetical protein